MNNEQLNKYWCIFCDRPIFGEIYKVTWGDYAWKCGKCEKDSK